MDMLLSHKGHRLVFEDRFDGSELDRSRWNVELHEPGWVNQELQEYVDSPENIRVQNGRLLLHPVKRVHGDGSISYTSGRISTQHKHDFTYGLFEARLKVPRGKGFLPAFWLMTTDEDRYGQWPECGEIDICEILGSRTSLFYGISCVAVKVTNKNFKKYSASRELRKPLKSSICFLQVTIQ